MTAYDDYFYPGTYTLQNKLGIRDPDGLEIAERRLTAERARQPMGPIELSGEGLKRIHHHLFQDLYPWAGQFRTVDMQKVVDKGPNVTFTPAIYVARVEIPRFFNELNIDMNVNKAFADLDPQTFSHRAAIYIADLNNIHPFPEGNGRTQRMLLSEIAQRSGYQLDQTKINREQWIAGAIDSRGQDQGEHFGPHKVMTGVIQRSISPIQRLISDQTNDIGDQFLAADAQTRLADPRMRNAQLQLQVGLKVAEREAGRSINDMPEIAAKLVNTVSEQLRAGKIFDAPRIMPDQGDVQAPEIKPQTL